jgi:hypothetical protein
VRKSGRVALRLLVLTCDSGGLCSKSLTCDHRSKKISVFLPAFWSRVGPLQDMLVGDGLWGGVPIFLSIVLAHVFFEFFDVARARLTEVVVAQQERGIHSSLICVPH